MIILSAAFILCRFDIKPIYADVFGAVSAGEEVYEVHTIHKSGNDNENFNILFLGDGYTASEQSTF